MSTPQGDRPDAPASNDPDAIKADIEATREQLGRTVDELSQRLDVPARAKEGAARAKDTAVETYRESPPTVIGAGLFGGAGLFAFFGLAALITTAILLLDLVLPAWLAALIVAVVLFAVAGALALVGKKDVQKGSPPVPTEAIASTKTDIQTVKESARR